MHIRRSRPDFLAALALSLAFLASAAPPCAAQSDDISALVAAAGTSEDHDGADVVIVFDRTDSRVEPSGLSHVVQHRLLKALTATGARSLAFRRFNYDPVSQLIEIRRARIHRHNGDVVDIDPASAMDVTQPMHGIYWGARMLALQIPRLEVGDALELETYRKGFMIAYLGEDNAANHGDGHGNDTDESRYIPPMRGHWYDVQVFAAGHPMLEKTVTVHTPRDKPLQYSTYNDAVHSEVVHDEAQRHYRFWRLDCAALPSEWRRANPQDFAPKVVMATVADWQAKSRWFWDVNRNQFDSTPEIDALVKQVTRGIKRDEDKVHALNHWAAQNIRYCGLNMGEGEGYVLHPGEMILRERSGVCKDIAGMTITLCRAAGYEVYPAMTMAGARVEAIPADQFNHCIGAWKKPDGTWHMLDPTWIPFSRYDWSRAEGEQHYVIGTPWGESLASIRAYTPDENVLQLELRGKIDDHGTLRGTLHIEGRGHADTRLRRTIGDRRRDSIEPQLRTWLDHLGQGAELTKWTSGKPDNWDRSMTLEVEFLVPGFALVGPRTCSWNPAALNLILAGYGGVVRLANPPQLSDDRATPAMLWWAQEVVLDERIEVPRGFEPTLDTAAWQDGGDQDFAACDVTAEIDGRTVAQHGRFRYDGRQVPVDAWPAFCAAVSTLRDAGDANLVAWKEN